jgi:hypothetical protein
VAAQVFKLPAEYFKANFDRSAIPELQALLKFNTNDTVISKFAPVLYPHESREVRKDALLFRASEPALVRNPYTLRKAIVNQCLAIAYKSCSIWGCVA